jgi:hypothetical protein
MRFVRLISSGSPRFWGLRFVLLSAAICAWTSWDARGARPCRCWAMSLTHRRARSIRACPGSDPHTAPGPRPRPHRSAGPGSRSTGRPGPRPPVRRSPRPPGPMPPAAAERQGPGHPAQIALIQATMPAAINSNCSGPVATTPMRSSVVLPCRSVGRERTHRRRVQADEVLADPKRPAGRGGPAATGSIGPMWTVMAQVQGVVKAS